MGLGTLLVDEAATFHLDSLEIGEDLHVELLSPSLEKANSVDGVAMDMEGEFDLQVLRQMFEQVLDLVVLREERPIRVLLEVIQNALAELIPDRRFLYEALNCL